jgi:hypothetical protein
MFLPAVAMWEFVDAGGFFFFEERPEEVDGIPQGLEKGEEASSVQL